jgi:hypothetical protein
MGREKGTMKKAGCPLLQAAGLQSGLQLPCTARINRSGSPGEPGRKEPSASGGAASETRLRVSLDPHQSLAGYRGPIPGPGGHSRS